MARSIGIVGAGIAGLVTAKVMKQFGFSVTVFEKECDVGGVWSAARRYPGLTTQNPRDTYELSDFPMPSDCPEWPSGEQVQAYLASYVRAFSLTKSVLLNTEVTGASHDSATNQWIVTSTQSAATLPSRTLLHRFDFLIVCNGIFSVPAVPEFAGVEEFRAAGGRVCHTSEFVSLADARGKNILVIGYGKSSCDVANATVSVSTRTTVIVRGLIWKIPKKLLNVLNFKYLFLTRLGEGLFRYIRVRGFEKFLHGPGLPLRNCMLRSVERIVARQLGLEALGLHPRKPLETIARSTVSLVTDGFYENVRHGRLIVKIQASINKLAPGQAHLTTGEVLPADLVVCGTGWQQLVPFFDRETRARITDARGNFRLYRTMMPVDVPNLAFNGYNSSFFSQLNAEIGALWLADYLMGGVRLPSRVEMNSYIDERLRWMEARTDGRHSKGTNIIPFSVHHMDELLEDIGMRLGVFTRLRQWFFPIVGADYRPLTKRLLARHRLAGISGAVERS